MDQNDDILADFLIESFEGIDHLDEELILLEQDPTRSDVLAKIFRTVHTIKGACSFLSLERLCEIAHHGENLLSLLRAGKCGMTTSVSDALLGMADALRGVLNQIARDGSEGSADHSDLLARLQKLVDAPPDAGCAQPATGAVEEPVAASVTSSVVRVDVGLLDQLMNLVGELVLARNQILQTTTLVDEPSALAACQRLNHVTSELQERVMKTRMQQVGSAWTKLPRAVRDLAASCGKQVDLELSGHATELDKAIIETIRDPMTHAVRNAIDHGIETPEERVALGKPSTGTLRIRAFHEGGQVNIEVSDDGRGVDVDKVVAKAIANGLVSAESAAKISERELLQLIMHPGFSTAEQVTNISGRGVGMDVVKTCIEGVGGTVEVHSTPGEGTMLRIKIPLTLAIVPALLVTSRGERFAIPQANLLELVRLDVGQGGRGIEFIHGAPVFRLRGELLPLVDLDKQLAAGDREPVTKGAESLVVLQADGRQFGLIVESVLDTQEIVVKPLGRLLGSVRSFAGAAIMGDGRVALILDVMGLAEGAGVLAEGGGCMAGGGRQGKEDAGSVSSWLVLVAAGRQLAIELGAVARLETLNPIQIEKAGDCRVVQYRGEVIPVVAAAELFGESTSDDRGEDLPLVMVRDSEGRVVGIAFDAILDIVEEEVETTRGQHARWSKGIAVLEGRVTEVLDVAELARLGQVQPTACSLDRDEVLA